MGLTQKIMLVISLVIVALATTTLAFTTRQADRLAHETIDKALEEVGGVWEAYQADRYRLLKLGVRPLANDPAIKALIEENPEDFATISDTLGERGKDIAANLFLVTDPNGAVIGSTDKAAEGMDLANDPLLQRALAEHADAATLWRRGNKLFHAVAEPMLTGGDLKGVLVAGYEVDETLAKQLSKLTHCEIAFVAQPAGQPALLSASSLGTRQPDFAAQLGAPLGDGGPRPFNLELDGEGFVAVRAPLKDATGQVLGSIVALRSLATEMAAFGQFRQSLILISVVVMVAALGLAYVVATRITGPVRTLVRLVERARDGSYSGAVSVATSDEIGALSRSFNSLLAELREKEQLIHFLREGMTEVRRAGSDSETLVGSDETGAINAISAQAGVQVEKGKLFAGRYEILSTLGKGGMGIVYRAEDKKLDDVVALKVLRPEVLKDDPTLIKRFKEELRLARKITHRNVLRTHDFDDVDGTPYISMEYLEGVTLKDLIQSKGALPVGVGLRICKQMCSGLEAAHRQGVVHRDIKPQNMLIVPETGELKIMDFGIARRSEVQAEAGLTTDGMVMGTPDYMAPEQAQAKPVDLRSDVYALGVVFFEVFTGKLPFRGETLMATVLKHIQEPPPDPRTLAPRLPEDLAAVILLCMEKDPGKRFQKVSEIYQELTAISSRLDSVAA